MVCDPGRRRGDVGREFGAEENVDVAMCDASAGAAAGDLLEVDVHFSAHGGGRRGWPSATLQI